MSAEDFAFAIDITNQMDWGLTDADFEFMLKLEPKGSFVLLDDSERAGIATTVSFGPVGWFGNLIVQKDRRKGGGGSLLVNHALKYLQTKKVRTVGLYAYPDAISFYSRLGFKCDSDFWVFRGTGSSSSADSRVVKAGRLDLDQTLELDRSCFGGNRRKMLEPILTDPGNVCYVVFEDNRLVGFIAAAVYGKSAEIGPLVCNHGRNEVAIDLLNATLGGLKGYDVSLCIGEKEASIIDALTERGFNRSFKVSRMFFGSAVTRDCIYAAESLERG
jgi:GNAT superfamily N-acetyltransferase